MGKLRGFRSYPEVFSCREEKIYMINWNRVDYPITYSRDRVGVMQPDYSQEWRVGNILPSWVKRYGSVMWWYVYVDVFLYYMHCACCIGMYVLQHTHSGISRFG